MERDSCQVRFCFPERLGQKGKARLPPTLREMVGLNPARTALIRTYYIPIQLWCLVGYPTTSEWLDNDAPGVPRGGFAFDLLTVELAYGGLRVIWTGLALSLLGVILLTIVGLIWTDLANWMFTIGAVLMFIGLAILVLST